ncbi:SPFH domain-containing protein [Kribbella sp. NPDC004875]|uniref:SPFH domain-containing protein n=1 Tax=Kribbella sp. NPDC004875 TaxID=3364107 RepID=UPI0036C79C21
MQLDTTAPHPWAILAILLVLAVAAAIEPRAARRDHWLVVLRAGRVARVVRSGFTVRIPVLERYVWLPKAHIRSHFVVPARTRDGVEVRLAGEVELRIVDPVAAAGVAPLDVALDEIERALARLIAGSGVATLAGLPAYLELVVDVPGVRAGAVELGTVEVALWTPASAARQTK